MVYEFWYRNRKFNPALQADGSLNFAGFFKRPAGTESYNPLTTIIEGLTKEERTVQGQKTVMKPAPCQLYVSFITLNRSLAPNQQRISSLYLRSEEPLFLDHQHEYHGYVLKKVSSEEIKVRRLQEVRTANTRKLQPFGEEKQVAGNSALTEFLALKELFEPNANKPLRIKNRVAQEIANILYGLWP